MSRSPRPSFALASSAAGLAFGLILTTIGLAGCGDREAERAKPLAVFGEIADFALVDHAGEPFTRADMRGKAWVADFFFTRCPSVCPQMTLKMQGVTRQWLKEERVHFLSLSVDPEHDTPEQLRTYREARSIRDDRWTFATGAPAAIRSLCLESFKLALGDEMDENGDITHSARFILVDGMGQIRGYYHALDEDGLEPLHADLAQLLSEQEVLNEG